MFLRSHAVADFTFAHKVAALRLPFSGDPGRATGKNLQTPCLLAKETPGFDRTKAKLDYLFLAWGPISRTEAKSEVFAGLRPNRGGIQARLGETFQASKELLPAARYI